MDLSELNTETLESELKRASDYIRWSNNLVSQQGGWMFWDGAEVERVEKAYREIKSELDKRNNIEPIRLF